jgi:hypothetical protein
MSDPHERINVPNKPLRELEESFTYKSGMVELRYEVRGHRGESRNAT